jgi:hypothetical protein
MRDYTSPPQDFPCRSLLQLTQLIQVFKETCGILEIAANEFVISLGPAAHNSSL